MQSLQMNQCHLSSKHFRYQVITVFIYIYIYICVCVCLCVWCNLPFILVLNIKIFIGT
jgi:hypothetical protein